MKIRLYLACPRTQVNAINDITNGMLTTLIKNKPKKKTFK